MPNIRTYVHRTTKVLMDVSMGRASDRVREFIIRAYVKGMDPRSCDGTAEKCDFEGSTSVFTKRRYRNRWNRIMVTRIAKEGANHNLRIKARVRARGSRGQNWYSETRSQFVKKKARTQSLWMLHLAGDFHHTLERERPKPKPVLMTGSMW